MNKSEVINRIYQIIRTRNKIDYETDETESQITEYFKKQIIQGHRIFKIELIKLQHKDIISYQS